MNNFHKDNENEIDGKLPPPVTDGFLEKIKNHLLQTYLPTKNYTEKTLTLSTSDIYSQLQMLYPSNAYTPEDIARWLNDAGYSFFDAGEIRLEWMLLPYQHETLDQLPSGNGNES